MSLCGALAVCILGVSYLAEWAFSLEPCFLCKWQRIPYYFVVLMACLAYFLKKHIWIKRAAQVACCAGVVLASWHVLVLMGIVADSCAIQERIDSIEQFQKMLNHSLPCSHAVWRLLGIPAAVYNGVFSLAMLIVLWQPAVPELSQEYIVLRINSLIRNSYAKEMIHRETQRD